MAKKISTGIDGLDQILEGGLIPNRAYLLKGGPGTGKSTIGYHFLQQAKAEGKSTLYITLGESAENIRQNAKQISVDLEGINILDLTPSEDIENEQATYNIFHAAEIELTPILDALVEKIKKHQPTRIVLDSVTMLRMLNEDPYHFRNMILSLIKFINSRKATLLMISESSYEENNNDITFWADGIIRIKYEPEWRKISVSKYRGSDFRHGNHAFKITGNGTFVFPRLQPGSYERKFTSETLSSGVKELDLLMSGGVEKGTISLITGPTGVGKTNLGTQFIKQAASRNERSTIYTFEESIDLILRRSSMINIPIEKMINNGTLKIMAIDPFTYSPDEFSQIVRRDVEENDTRIVMIDSIGGYSLAVREENALERLHSLMVYLQNMGVTGLLTNETSNITGEFEATNMQASYLADNIIFLRYIEMEGELQKTIGVLKKRLSDFDRTIHEFQITSEGIKVGRKLTHLRNILSGSPVVI